MDPDVILGIEWIILIEQFVVQITALHISHGYIAENINGTKF